VERRADLAAGNEAVFVLSQYFTLFTNLHQQAYIDRAALVRKNNFGREPHYTEYIGTAVGWNSTLRLPFDRLGFLLQTYDPNLLGRLAVLDRSIISLLDAQQTRNRQHENFQRRLAEFESHMAEGTIITFEIVETHVGRDLALQLEQLTKFILKNLPDCLKKISRLTGDLTALLSYEFPFGRPIEINFKPAKFIDVDAASSPPPTWRKLLRWLVRLLRRRRRARASASTAAGAPDAPIDDAAGPD
jgi:hypothetical protein